MVAVPGSLVSWVHNGWRPASPTPIVGRLSWRSPQPPAGWRVVLARRRLPPVSITKCGGRGLVEGLSLRLSGEPPFVPRFPFGVGEGVTEGEGFWARAWARASPLALASSSRIIRFSLRGLWSAGQPPYSSARFTRSMSFTHELRSSSVRSEALCSRVQRR